MLKEIRVILFSLYIACRPRRAIPSTRVRLKHSTVSTRHQLDVLYMSSLFFSSSFSSIFLGFPLFLTFSSFSSVSFSLYDCRGLIAFSLQNWIRPLSQIIVYELFDRCSRAVYAEMQCIISFGNISLQCVDREKI